MSTNSSPDSHFLNAIKNRTSESHKKLENLSISASITSPEMKISDYATYLSLMHDVHKSAEKILFPILNEQIDDLNQRKKTHLIEEDLNYLGVNKTTSDIVFYKTDISVPFALGMLYVIEGSSLGGRFILKNVTTISGLDTGNGIAYFSGYGDKTGSYWKNFLNFLSEYEQNYNQGDVVIEGAIYAFDSIYNHFRSVEV